MRNKYDLYNAELRAVEHKLDILKKQDIDIKRTASHLYRSILLGNKEAVDRYNSLREHHKKLLAHINLLEHKRFNLIHSKNKIKHQRSESRTKLAAASMFIIFMMIALMESLGPGVITGFATLTSTQVAVSNVTIEQNIAIISNNLSSISWNTTLYPDTDANPAWGNSDGAEGVSTYNISMGPNTSTTVDFCIIANETLTSGGDTFPLDGTVLTGYNYSANTTSDQPIIANSTEFRTEFNKHAEGVAKNGVVHYRFWLDVPQYQSAGEYTNNVTFKVLKAGLDCST